ncbi:hypothetical protein DSQ19_02905 [Candidatus Nitrosotenuis sp. DW1]|nr:hypothetical protein DSQ19_02905 [Candidatus Nitrosotenuis sp. DW1]
MTIRKAIMALDLLIENKRKNRDMMLDPTQSWNECNDSANRMTNQIAKDLQNDVDWLQAIKRQLLPEQHRTKIICRHPKKDHDVTSDGQKYCMNCNADL